MNLNEAYKAYAEDPSGGNKEILGEQLLQFCKAMFVKKLRDPAYRNSESSFQTMEDTLGDAILLIWERMPKYNPAKAGFSTWVTIVLKDELTRGFRDYAKRAEILLTNEAQVHPHRSIDEKLTMKQAIKTLSAQEQEFIKMHFEGYSDKAKGEHFGKNTKWSDNQLQIIKNKMRSFVGNNR
jgi:RNA polymerase sigma factor (sigma-70 family)